MRFLLFAPLVPLAFAIYFLIRRFVKTDPEEIYAYLVATAVGAIPMFFLVGALCRFLSNRHMIEMPNEVSLGFMAWAASIGVTCVYTLYDRWTQEANEN